jgi:hypothetical protein
MARRRRARNLSTTATAAGCAPRRWASFKEVTASDTVSGHHFQSNLELIEELALIKMLEQPAAEKAKEAEGFTCKYKGCTREYTDGSGSGSGTKYNCGYCSSECREAAKKATGQCQHGRRKRVCKDCGAGHCHHGRRKSRCKDCGTGHCQHGRQRGKRSCCQHVRHLPQKSGTSPSRRRLLRSIAFVFAQIHSLEPAF